MGTSEQAKPGPAKREPRRSAADGPADVGANLRRIRNGQGHSLEALATLSGVSRAMLGQIETGKSMPTVTLIWKVAKALGVPLSVLIEAPRPARVVLLPKASARVISANGGGFTLRAFAAPGGVPKVEFYEMRVAPGHHEDIGACAAGTRMSLVVVQGELDVAIDGSAAYHLTAGDAMLFDGGNAHGYCNPGAVGAIGYLVIVPARNSARPFAP